MCVSGGSFDQISDYQKYPLIIVFPQSLGRIFKSIFVFKSVSSGNSILIQTSTLEKQQRTSPFVLHSRKLVLFRKYRIASCMHKRSGDKIAVSSRRPRWSWWIPVRCPGRLLNWSLKFIWLYKGPGESLHWSFAFQEAAEYVTGEDWNIQILKGSTQLASIHPPGAVCGGILQTTAGCNETAGAGPETPRKLSE